jgi:acetyl-CoA carboxylase biotin carboxyl carrier protein
MSDGKSAPSKKRPNIDPDFVRELAVLLEETGLTEIEVEETGTRVRVARQGMPVAAYPAAMHLPATGAAPAAGKDAAPPKGTVVSSPMVGTAYLGPAPGAAPFVKPGDKVTDGQTVVIIEAMKTMNQVPSTVGGRVVEIYVQDGQPVEFGEPLMLID